MAKFIVLYITGYVEELEYSNWNDLIENAYASDGLDLGDNDCAIQSIQMVSINIPD